MEGRTFGVWGLAFKPKTDDMREAPAVTIINALIEAGAKIKCYDPKAMDLAKKIFKDKVEYCTSSYEALNDCDAMILMTEWNEFRRPDFEKIKNLLKQAVIFDGRNQYDGKRLMDKGFEYYRVGENRGDRTLYI